MSETALNNQVPQEPVDPTQANKGVLPGLEGIILQRGGEELKLKKVTDRLTVCLQFAAALPDLVEQWQPQSRNITPQVTQAQDIIVEWQLPAPVLDEALSALRAEEAVAYASHVYSLEASPGTYVYIANQLTVQFAGEIAI